MSEQQELTQAIRSGQARGGFKSSEQVEAEAVAQGITPESEQQMQDAAAGVAVDPPALAEEITFEDPNAEPVAEVTQEAASAEAAPVTQDAGKGIRIGDKVFKSQEEAFAYAEELDRKSLVDDAFRQGLEAAQITQNSNSIRQQQIEPQEEKIPDEFYTDPAKFFKKREQEIEQRIVQQTLTIQQRQKTHEQTMSKFWSDYPDLAENTARRQLAEKHIAMGIQKWGNLETDKALKLIADEARKELKELGVTTLPSKPLPSNTKPAASPGAGVTTTRPKQDEKPLNFVQQMRSIKSKRRG